MGGRLLMQESFSGPSERSVGRNASVRGIPLPTP
jgi:hypothetical protein